jgi:uncharacterized protein YbjT (DUF2867 family)
MSKTALIAGSTGLIGSQLLPLLCEHSVYQKVIALTRQPLGYTHAKLEPIITDASGVSSLGSRLQAHHLFCCLGTTMRQAKTKDAFRQVDYHYPLALATLGRQWGAQKFLLVSALGASASSAIFYNRVKGEAEDAIKKAGFDTLHIFRPSLLLGPRTEKRPGEDAAKLFYKIFGGLIPKKWQAIESIKVARAMVAMADSPETGIHVHESAALQKF